jgi:transposase-like protein
VFPPMAIVWSCPISVEQYEAIGRNVQVPRPSCPDCSHPMTFSSGYQRWVRAKGVCHLLWFRRSRCSRCSKSHALIPSFCLLNRLDSVVAVGEALVSVVMGVTGVRPVAKRLEVPYTTVRGWVRSFAKRAAILAAGFSALAVRYCGLAPELVAVSPGEQALISISNAYDLAVTRTGIEAVPGLFDFASLVTVGAMIATTINPPWLVLGRRRFIPPVPKTQTQEEKTHDRQPR